MLLDYFTKNGYASPQLWKGNTLYTKKIFTQCKKHAPHLLQYFTIGFDIKGNELLNVTIPPAFEGHILNQFNVLLYTSKR